MGGYVRQQKGKIHMKRKTIPITLQLNKRGIPLEPTKFYYHRHEHHKIFQELKPKVLFPSYPNLQQTSSTHSTQKVFH